MTASKKNSSPSFTVEDLKGSKLYIATPMYGNICSGHYTANMIELGKLCLLYQVEMGFFRIGNESLITRARNNCAHMFLQSPYEYLMFIDADISFEPKAVLEMIYLMKKNPDYDVLVGAYPKKRINWNNIKKAASIGVGAKNPSDLEYFIGDFVVNFIDKEKSITATTDLSIPIEVAHGGTGFMMIRKPVFNRFIEAYPESYCVSMNEENTQKTYLFFECGPDPKTRHYLSEDYMFCQKIRDIGMKVLLCPWIILTHEGSFRFLGGLQQHQIAGTGIKHS